MIASSVSLSLWPMLSQVLVTLAGQMWVPSHRMGLKPNQKVLRYFIAFVPLLRQYVLQAGLCCGCGVVAG